MLILTRKSRESVIIDHDIKVTVLSVRGSQVRLGIEAPDGCVVNREEVEQRIRTEQENWRRGNE